MSADTAEDRGRIKLLRWPNQGFVRFSVVMTLSTRVPPTTAFEIYCDDVKLAAIVDAASITVNWLAADLNAVDHAHLRLAHRRRQSYFLCFRRVANFRRAGLIFYRRTNADSITAKVCRNFDRERKPHRTLVHVDSAFRKVEFSI